MLRSLERAAQLLKADMSNSMLHGVGWVHRRVAVRKVWSFLIHQIYEPRFSPSAALEFAQVLKLVALLCGMRWALGHFTNTQTLAWVSRQRACPRTWQKRISWPCTTATSALKWPSHTE